jgi:hypothetical protein
MVSVAMITSVPMPIRCPVVAMGAPVTTVSMAIRHTPMSVAIGHLVVAMGAPVTTMSMTVRHPVSRSIGHVVGDPVGGMISTDV